MPWSSFPHQVIAIGLAGQDDVIVADLPMAENVPIEGVPTGARMVQWKPLEPATLVWAEALDGGDPRREVEHRDRWLFRDLARGGEAREILRTAERATGLAFFERPELVLADEYDRDRRWTKSSCTTSRRPSRRHGYWTIARCAIATAIPGRIVRKPVGSELSVAIVENGAILRSGEGATPAGNLPFLDRQDLSSGASERLWRSEPGTYESFVQLLPSEGEGSFLSRHESQSAPPNWRVRELGSSEIRAITSFPDPQPSIRGIQKRCSRMRARTASRSPPRCTCRAATRAARACRSSCGPIRSSSTIPRPPVRSRPAPPASPSCAGSSHLFLLTQGWAILDDATMPIVGDPETMNDTFVEQLVAVREGRDRRRGGRAASPIPSASRSAVTATARS